ncbi:hypothetical protein NC652_019465 [Populus alba x Populus x berolinensis]|nr:hypothetical protein NC652_019465 [Populus alba x Populus x berolinensis]
MGHFPSPRRQPYRWLFHPQLATQSYSYVNAQSDPLTNCHSSICCKLTGEGPEINHGKYPRCGSCSQDWKILGERLLLKDIPAVTVFLNRNQKYQ